MQTFRDFLVWYNNLDVQPFCEALEKMCSFWKEKNIWELAQQVATCRLDIQIHPSWKDYIVELYKHPRSSVYLTYF